MIKFENVTKKFPLGNVALDNVSFTIDNNDFVFLVGPSGAGKTTIINLILRTVVPTKGSVNVDDFNLTSRKFSKVELLRRNIGVVFQDFKIIQDKNVYENVALGLKVVNYPASKIKTAVEEALQLVKLSKKEKVFPLQLSAGEMQRVAIARAIIGQRNIILADEPTGNLDPKTSWEIMKIFKELEGKKTIIIATHNTDIVNSMQKRVIMLKDGKLITDEEKGGYSI